MEDHSDVWFDPIGASELWYQQQYVRLSLTPGATMTWRMWFGAAIVLGIFINEYDCLAFEYEVEVAGGSLGVIGSGSLSAWR